MLERLSRAASWPRDQWISRYWLDYALVAGVVGAHALAAWRLEVPALLGAIPLQNRPGLYTASALSISLAGTIASLAVGQFLNAKGTRARYLKTRHPDELAGTWKSIFYGSILATALILTAYGFDARYTTRTGQDTGSSIGSWLFEAAALLALLRLLRLVALFGDLVDIIVRDETTPLEAEPLDFNPAFFGDTKKAGR